MFLTATQDSPRAAGIGSFSRTFICPLPHGITRFLKVLDGLVGLADAELEAVWQEIIDHANATGLARHTRPSPRYPDRPPPAPLHAP